MTPLVLFTAGREMVPPVSPYGIGDWVKARDGRLIELTAWPTMRQIDDWSPVEVRCANGDVWRSPA